MFIWIGDGSARIGWQLAPVAGECKRWCTSPKTRLSANCLCHGAPRSDWSSGCSGSASTAAAVWLAARSGVAARNGRSSLEVGIGNQSAVSLRKSGGSTFVRQPRARQNASVSSRGVNDACYDGGVLIGLDHWCGAGRSGVFSVHRFLGNQTAVSRRRSGDRARPSESGDDGKLQLRPRSPSPSVHE